jgi:tRNA 2-selenouridine synthase
MLSHIEGYTELFLNDVPLMDVRAPVEFQRGSFPNSENLPILDDQQRETVGTYYKYLGKDTAIDKGNKLFSGYIRESRVATWLDFAKRNPNGYLYCFRGGLRSHITQQWMQESGVTLPIVRGGFKALRSYLLNVLEESASLCRFKLVGGKTGSGKTILINELSNSINLEAAAYHRGSSFGRHAQLQNSQINFENILAIDFLKLRCQKFQHIILEDEARTIGKACIPKPLFEKMRKSPVVVIEEPYEVRLERLMQEYIIGMQAEFICLDGKSEGFISFESYLLDSIDRIQKRLGPTRYSNIRKSMEKAIHLQSKTGEITKHYDWLTAVLDNYYDPMYEDQLAQRKDTVCFRGNYNACREYLKQAF